MKYKLIAVDPEIRGMAPESARLVNPQHLEMHLKEMAGQFPGEKLYVFQPVELYQSKVNVDLTKYAVTPKGEVIPQ